MENQIYDDLYKLWREVLKVDDIEKDDDFIVIGGDSLKAALLYTLIEKHFSIQIPVTSIYQNSTLEKMSKFIASYVTKINYRHLVKIKDGDDSLSPIFLFPGTDGDPVHFHVLAHALDTKRSIYGLRYMYSEDLVNFDQLIDIYLMDILSCQKEDDFYFVGSSIGGKSLLSVANRLVEQGKEIKMAALLDTIFVKKRKSHLNYRFIKGSILRIFNEIKYYSFSDYVVILKRKLITLVNIIFNESFLKKIKNRKLERSIQDKRDKNQMDLLDRFERMYFLSKIYKTIGLETYSFPIQYFYAKKSRGMESYNYLTTIAQNIEKIDMDCYHSEFVGYKYANETANHLKKYFKF